MTAESISRFWTKRILFASFLWRACKARVRLLASGKRDPKFRSTEIIRRVRQIAKLLFAATAMAWRKIEACQ